MHAIWLGTEASHFEYKKYHDQFQFNKEAFFRTPDDEPVHTDDTFGVMSDRMGLSLLEKVGETVVLKVHGSLVNKYSRWHGWFPGEVTSYEAIRDALKIANESGNKSVLMDFSTGGGSVNGLDVTTRLMARFRRGGMKIDAHTDTSAFSAGYWLMAAARQITASPQSEQGSIGTMAVLRTYANTEENLGVKFTVIKAGKFKALGNPYEELTKEGLAYLQKNIDEANRFFLEHVAKHRNLSLEDTAKWAEGQTFYAQQALEVGLIDKLATLDDLIGGGPTAVNQSVNRRYEMQISAEKLAQIASGADPKTVLTDAEFTYYTEQLEKNAEAGDGDKPEDGEKPTDAEKPAETEKPKTEASNAAGDSGLAVKMAEQAREIGRLEAKLEASEAKVASLGEQVEANAKQLENMVIMGQSAVNKLQVALGLPKQAESNPTKLLEQFNTLNSKMAEVFKVGQQSSTPNKDKPAAVVDFRHSVSQLSTQKR